MGDICYGGEMSYISTNTARIFIIKAAILLHYTPEYAGYASGPLPYGIHVHKPCSVNRENHPWKVDAT
jgi:hypothetical protein